ncbi:MAG TPA: formate dehydrogenase accessory protein FdhE [Anaeromyxobacter sp.]|nr:formate dehydrogenase accessory protein FdhE [Anaeromyxobacter sp.]
MTASYSEEPARAEPLRLPDPALLFEERAARFRALAEGHAAPEWLLLLSRVAAGQRAAVRDVAVEPVRAGAAGPPLAHDRLPRDGAWRRMLGAVVAAARAPGLPGETLDALRRLEASEVSQLEALADAVLGGNVPPDRLACAPFVAAALQAWFAALSSRLDPAALGGGAASCPVCGAPPVAGVVQGTDRLRYLSCALCAAEWNVPRLRCTACGKEGDLSYLHVDGDDGAKAEACGGCRAYLKLFDEAKRPGAEAAADDAATLALDLLLGEEGWRRAGVNLYVGAAGADA